jgi:hypothetical protein
MYDDEALRVANLHAVVQASQSPVATAIVVARVVHAQSATA